MVWSHRHFVANTTTSSLIATSVDWTTCTSRGSRKNTDLFPKLNERRRRKLSGKFGGMLSLETFLDFNLTPLSPFSWVSESFRQDIDQFRLPWMKPCNLKSLFLLKIYYENSDRFPCGSAPVHWYIADKWYLKKTLNDLERGLYIPQLFYLFVCLQCTSF